MDSPQPDAPRVPENRGVEDQALQTVSLCLLSEKNILTDCDMETLGIAGGIVSIVSLFIQLADRVQILLDFWRSFQEAPEDVQFILRDLQQLRDILQHRAGTISAPSQLLLDVVGRCHQKIERLEGLLEDLEPGFKSPHRVVRKWHSFKATLRRNCIKEFRDALADTKTDLILVNQNISE